MHYQVVALFQGTMLTNDDTVGFHHAPPEAIIPENGFYAPDVTRVTQQDENYSRPTEERIPVLDQNFVPQKDNALCRTGTSGVCPMCNGYFQRLDNHVRTHLDSRPFPCNQCQKCFRQRTHLLRHLETHKRMQSFPCTYCGKTLTRKDKLKQHMSRTCKILREY